MSDFYLEQYTELKNTFDINYKLVIIYLFKPNPDEDNGMEGNGHVFIAKPKLVLTNMGYTIKGIIIKTTVIDDLSGNVQVKKTFDSLYLTLNHLAMVAWSSIHVIENNDIKSEIPVNTITTKHMEQYLVQKNYRNIGSLRPSEDNQKSMTYISTFDSRESTQEYKLHVVCKINKWKECFDKLLNYVNNNQTHIHQFKFGLPSPLHIVDYSNDITRTYLEWNNGASTANFIIYFKAINSRRITQHEFITEFLSQFIPYWTADNFDIDVARESNVLSYNERLTRSLFITYDIDSSTKAEYVRINEEKTINDTLEPFRGKQFKMSDELKKEKEYICESRDMDKLKSFQECLKDKYNLTIAELCSDEINDAHAWKQVYGYGDVTPSIDIERCYSLADKA